jgi:monomeric isocitrate dehydrogenase
MHPTEHRGLRELYAMTRRLRAHWRTLASRLDSTAPEHAQLLRAGSDLARAMLGELKAVTAARDVYGQPLAQGLGNQLAGVRSHLLDPALEINQALRYAVLDVVHVVTLLDYLARVAAQDGDAELQAFLAGWSAQMHAQEATIRAAAAALGDDPDLGLMAATPGLAGKLGHGAASAFGTLGEWVDRRAGR